MYSTTWRASAGPSLDERAGHPRAAAAATRCPDRRSQPSVRGGEAQRCPRARRFARPPRAAAWRSPHGESGGRPSGSRFSAPFPARASGPRQAGSGAAREQRSAGTRPGLGEDAQVSRTRAPDAVPVVDDQHRRRIRQALDDIGGRDRRGRGAAGAALRRMPTRARVPACQAGDDHRTKNPHRVRVALVAIATRTASGPRIARPLGRAPSVFPYPAGAPHERQAPAAPSRRRRVAVARGDPAQHRRRRELRAEQRTGGPIIPVSRYHRQGASTDHLCVDYRRNWRSSSGMIRCRRRQTAAGRRGQLALTGVEPRCRGAQTRSTRDDTRSHPPSGPRRSRAGRGPSPRRPRRHSAPGSTPRCSSPGEEDLEDGEIA